MKKLNLIRSHKRSAPVIKSGNTKSRFVIQKHNASTLHYDLRLEMGGVLKSWAVPKGPSLNPADKRLAVETEDHPLSYASFEGTIPKGSYGARSVIVWDNGTWVMANDEPPVRAYQNGKIQFQLYGKKLQGGFVLIKMHRRADKQWLLIKLDDAYTDRLSGPVSLRPESVLSGETKDGL